MAVGGNHTGVWVGVAVGGAGVSVGSGSKGAAGLDIQAVASRENTNNIREPRKIDLNMSINEVTFILQPARAS